MSSASTASPVTTHAVPVRGPQVSLRPQPRKPKWGKLLVIVIILACAAMAYYLGRSVITREHAQGERTVVPTVTAQLGDVDRTVRLSGVIAAERYAALLAPQLRGGRGDTHLSGNANTAVTMPRSSGSTSAPSTTSTTTQLNSSTSSSPSSTSNASATGSPSSMGSSSSPSTASTTPSATVSSSNQAAGPVSTDTTSLGAKRGTTNRFKPPTTNAAPTRSRPPISSSSTGSNLGSTASNLISASARGGGGGSDFMLVLVKLAKAGGFVHKGEVVAEFDRQYQLNRLDDFKAGVAQLEAGVAKLKADLAVAKEAHQQLVRVAKADLDKTRLDLKTIEVRSAIESEKFKLSASEADARYKQMLAEIPLFDSLQAAQLRAAEVDLEQARIDLQRATMNVERMVLRAPVDGAVVMQSIWRGGDFGQVQEGDQVWPGTFFMQVVDPGSMVVNATVNQTDSDHLRIGMKADVRLDGYPGMVLPAHIVGIGAITKTPGWRANFVKEIPVRLKLDQVDPRLLPDLSASADVVLESERQVIIAPRQAIFHDGGTGRAFVLLKDASAWRRRYVDLGVSNHVAAAVRSGIHQGDVLAAQLVSSQVYQ